MTKRVLITRTPDRAAKLLDLLRKDGIDSFAVPVTRVVHIADNAIPELDDYNWLAFTSANGVKTFGDALKKYGGFLPVTTKIASIGSVTAKEIKRVLKAPDIVAENADGLTLAGEILETSNDPGELSVLWPCAEKSLLDFPDRLKKAGANIDRWVCYRVEPIDSKTLLTELKSTAPWDIVLYAAPSAVRAFSDAWSERDEFTALAIGQTTLKELKKSGFSDTALSRGVSNRDCAKTINEILDKRNVESS
ncbi:MAG: uroporphyrinogen-III synthase [candidate division Zixibacteria bacterium]